MVFRYELLLRKSKIIELWQGPKYTPEPEAYTEPCQTSRIELFAKRVNGLKPLTIFAKSSILDVWQGSEYIPALAPAAKVDWIDRSSY